MKKNKGKRLFWFPKFYQSCNKDEGASTKYSMNQIVKLKLTRLNQLKISWIIKDINILLKFPKEMLYFSIFMIRNLVIYL